MRKTDPGFFMGVGGSLLDDYIFIDIHDTRHRNIASFQRGFDGRAGRRGEREEGVEYSMTEGGDVFYILTIADGAKDLKICQAPVTAPGKDNWTEVVAHEPGRADPQSHGLCPPSGVAGKRRDGLPRIMIRDRRTGEEHAIAFAEEAYSLGLQGAAEYDTDVIRFSYSSMTTPSQLYDYNMATRERVLLKTRKCHSGHNPEDYVTRRVFATAHDGELVPVSCSTARTPNSTARRLPALWLWRLWHNHSRGFNTNCLSLVDRGFVYAIAHIRGGKDKGFQWYEDGKMEKKENTFKDFIAAADHLVKEGFTSYDNIIAEGGSAGGMLMGAVANMEPEKFAGIIAAVPFVDVLNTMLDDSLPLTPPEWPEWGNPIESEEEYRWIAAYSPYDNIGAKPYPPILALSGLTDPRVTYWEPTKWVAKLREHNTGDAPILLKTNMAAGHGGKSGRFSGWRKSRSNMPSL